MNAFAVLSKVSNDIVSTHPTRELAESAARRGGRDFYAGRIFTDADGNTFVEDLDAPTTGASAVDRTLARLLAADFIVDMSNDTIPAPPYEAAS